MKQELTAVIIDDEAKARRIMEALLTESCPEVKVLASAEDVLSGIKAINKHKPDIIFLDIEMPGYTGFQLLDFFDEIDFEVIFTTAYSEYAVQAFQVSAVDYLLKPIQMDQLKHAVEKVGKFQDKISRKRERLEVLRENMDAHQINKIALPTSNGLIFIATEDVIYFEADGSYTNIYMADGNKFLISKKIKEFEVMLGNDTRFFRTHRSFLVNMLRIKQYIRHDGHIKMDNGSVVHLSRERKEEFNKLVNNLKV